MMKGVKWLLPAAAALGMAAAAPARAVDVKAGNWDLSLTGNVNAFATYTRCGVGGPGGPNADVILSHACTKVEGAPNTFAIESGLLPSAFVFTAKTRAYDLDVSATIGLYPGLHVSDTGTGQNKVGGTGNVAAGSDFNFAMDVRQNFITFGDKSWGTIKLGKDLGLFGADAILSDMTLLGVGSGTAGNPLRNHNVTLGHIGTGYLYADWIPQIAYISPSFGGAQLSVAVIEAFGMGYEGLGVGTNRTETPGVQGKLTYDFAGPYAGRVWAGGMYQNTKHDSTQDTPATTTFPSLDSYAGELGAKVNVQGLGALVYGYAGKGVGTTQFGLGATGGLNAAGDKIDGRTSFGGYAQVTYQIPGTKLRPGVSWGMSYLNQEAGDPDTLVHWNGMGTAALFYALTDTLTLVAEFDHLRSRNWQGGTAKSNSAALGAIMFF
jgi:predicted porin